MNAFRKFELVIPVLLLTTMMPLASAQDANNPIDPSPTFGIWNRFYGDDFSRVQGLGNITYGDWFYRVSAEGQINYESGDKPGKVNFNGANFMVARLFDFADGRHKVGFGGIVSYFEGKGTAAGVSGVSVSKLGSWKVITLTTFQAGNDISKIELQPGLYRSFNDGWYFRSHPRMLFDLETNKNEVPVGAGFGRTFASADRVYNFFFEPQYDLAADRWMLYAGMKVLF
jgi:hypothetical protein